MPENMDTYRRIANENGQGGGKQKTDLPIINFLVRLVKGKSHRADDFANFFGGLPNVKFGEVTLRMRRSDEEERG